MYRGFGYAMCATLWCALWCGCGRQPSAEAAAQAPRALGPAGQPASGTPVAAPPRACLQGRTLAEFVDDRIVFFAAVPDLASLAALLADSPLHAVAKDADFSNALGGLIGAKAWGILGHEIRRASQGLMRGQAEVAVMMAADAEGGLRTDVYALWNAGDDAARAVGALADFAAALREKMPELAVGETTLDGVAVRTVAFGLGDARTWYFASCAGEVRISTDTRFFGALAPVPRCLRQSQDFTRTLARVQSAGFEIAFVYAHLGRVLGTVLDTAGGEGPWEDVGVAGMGAAGVAAYRSAGKIRDVWHIEWPDARRGLMAPFVKKANVRGALAVVPADVGFFAVIGIDLLDAWARARACIAKAWPEAWAALDAQTGDLSAAIGTDAGALLKAFGPDIIVYERAGASPIPGALVLSVRQREILRDAVRKIEERAGRPLLRESVDGNPIYATPGPIELYVGLCEQHLVASPDIDAVRDFVRNRRGRTNPLAGRGEIREILAHDQLGGMVYVNPDGTQAEASQAVVSALAMQEEIPPEMGACLREVGRVVPQKLGPMWMVFQTSRDGMSGEIRSDWGAVPMALGAGSFGAVVALPAVVHAWQGRGERKVFTVINAIVTAQEEFHARNNRYAQNLSELKNVGRIDVETARGVSNGYVFKLKSGGERNWTFDARPMSGRGRYFYCDETGTIRAEADKPAHLESPVVGESP